MDNSSQLQQQHLVRKLLVILFTGLVSVFLIGILLYVDEKQVPVDIVMLIGNEAFFTLFLAGVCLVSLKLFRQRDSLKHYFKAGIYRLRKKSGSVTTLLNGLLFSVLTMALMLSAQAGGVDARQLFFMALTSAVTGILLARAWEGLTVSKTNT